MRKKHYCLYVARLEDGKIICKEDSHRDEEVKTKTGSASLWFSVSSEDALVHSKTSWCPRTQIKHFHKWQGQYFFFFFFCKGQFLRFTNTKVQHCHYRRLITVEEAALSVFSFWPFFLFFRTPHRTPKWTFSCYSSDMRWQTKVHVKAARCHSDGSDTHGLSEGF